MPNLQSHLMHQEMLEKQEADRAAYFQLDLRDVRRVRRVRRVGIGATNHVAGGFPYGWRIYKGKANKNG